MKTFLMMDCSFPAVVVLMMRRVLGACGGGGVPCCSAAPRHNLNRGPGFEFKKTHLFVILQDHTSLLSLARKLSYVAMYVCTWGFCYIVALWIDRTHYLGPMVVYEMTVIMGPCRSSQKKEVMHTADPSRSSPVNKQREEEHGRKHATMQILIMKLMNYNTIIIERVYTGKQPPSFSE